MISSQDGGIGRYTVPPRTTKISTTNLKTKTNQKCQKIELYGTKELNQGVKEETFIQTGRRGRDRQPGREYLWQGGSWRTGWPHICEQINWEEQLESKIDHAIQGSSAGK